MSPRNRASRRGKTWPAPAGATHIKTFEIYRYDPDSGANPQLDTFEVDLDDCGPMVLDALILDQEQGRFDADLPPLLPRGDLRLLRDEHRWHELARLHAIYFRPGRPATIYPLANLRIIKDLVPDLTHLFAQYAAIEPWLKSKTADPNGATSIARRSEARSTATTNASFASAALQVARAIGGTAIAFSAPRCSCRLGAG